MRLDCLRAATKAGAGPNEWTFDSSRLAAVEPYLRNRGKLHAAIEALGGWQAGARCGDPPSACAPTFSIPSRIATEDYGGKGTQRAIQSAQIACYQQVGRPLRQQGQVAVLFLDIANAQKMAVNNAKVVNNIVTLALSEPVEDRAGISVAVIGGQYAPTGSAYVIDGRVSLALEPAAPSTSQTWGGCRAQGPKCRSPRPTMTARSTGAASSPTAERSRSG